MSFRSLSFIQDQGQWYLDGCFISFPRAATHAPSFVWGLPRPTQWTTPLTQAASTLRGQLTGAPTPVAPFGAVELCRGHWSHAMHGVVLGSCSLTSTCVDMNRCFCLVLVLKGIDCTTGSMFSWLPGGEKANESLRGGQALAKPCAGPQGLDTSPSVTPHSQSSSMKGLVICEGLVAILWQTASLGTFCWLIHGSEFQGVNFPKSWAAWTGQLCAPCT